MNEDRIVDIFIIGAIITVIVLKITNVITIPWIWLLSPIWILFGMGLGFAIIITFGCLLDEYIHKRRKK